MINGFPGLSHKKALELGIKAKISTALCTRYLIDLIKNLRGPRCHWSPSEHQTSIRLSYMDFRSCSRKHNINLLSDLPIKNNVKFLASRIKSINNLKRNGEAKYFLAMYTEGFLGILRLYLMSCNTRTCYWILCPGSTNSIYMAKFHFRWNNN